MAYRKSAETRDRILKAAARIFSERGYYETNVGDIAAEAGIGRASFYYYYQDKEMTARALFDSYVDRLFAAANAAVPVSPDEGASIGNPAPYMLNTFVKYILMFKYIALNRATYAVYYDLVNFADYDAANIARLEHTIFKDTVRIAAAYGTAMSEADLIAFIVTSNSLAKALFKAIRNGTLDYSLEKAMDSFCRRAILPDIRIPETEYQSLLAEAFRLCGSISLDGGTAQW